MVKTSELKKMASRLGAEKCGIAGIDRFSQAPKGFHPRDIYPKTESVIVFLTSMPAEIVNCVNPVPYTGAASLMYAEIDGIGLRLSRWLTGKKIGAVPIPCDTPYIHWEADKAHGQGILSMRHAGFLAGLGYLGRNTLLITREFGSMIYVGAVLSSFSFEPDPVAEDRCPEKCRLCLDSCTSAALTGETVIQKRCREESSFKTERGFELYSCFKCRSACPRRFRY